MRDKGAYASGSHAMFATMLRSKFTCGLIAFLCLVSACVHTVVHAADSSLLIKNNSNADLLNIFVQPESGKGFFLRLDLSPNASDKVENPKITATLRIDTGLEFHTLPNVDLREIKGLTFEPDGAVALVNKEGESQILQAKTENLLPSSTPVCDLEKFHPKMPMRDVCSILDPEIPVDDNGALITGLGFAGLVWAARLAPAAEFATADAPLEHMELRRPLSRDDLNALLNALRNQGYVPWQAEYPGNDVDFDDLAGNSDRKWEALMDGIDKFMSRTGGLPDSNPGDVEPEASIMLAPAASLPDLENADAPSADVQLFTITLRPASRLLLVDVSAYQGSQTGAANNG